jgi:hypothetical protein
MPERSRRIHWTGTAHWTIIDAHPSHQPVGHVDHQGAGTYEQSDDANGLLCRAEED